MTEHVGGWLIDREDFAWLSNLPGEDEVLAMRGHYEEATLDPRELLRVENQGPVGSCQGHSISSCVEWCYILETSDASLQLSRAWGYYESQRIDGIRGDSGSTINAGVKLATTLGICREELWPYSNRYNPARPDNFEAVLADAAKYRIKSSVRLTSYEAVRTFLGSGQGAVHLGIAWGNSVNRAVVESFSGGGGGHAIGLYCLSDRKDNQGNPYCWMMNSWGGNWGNKGWAEWSPTAIEQMMRHRFTVMIGVSDMLNVKPRKFNLDDWKKELRG